jgi:hypothetical protein
LWALLNRKSFRFLLREWIKATSGAKDTMGGFAGDQQNGRAMDK